jgi:hypothetical protein
MIFVTPSYRPDLERLYCQRESIRRYCAEPASHLVVVPRGDYGLFRRKFAADPSVEILVQNDYVDPRFYPRLGYRILERIAKGQCWRLRKYAGRSGWIIQQIVKLAAPLLTDDPLILITDSDTIFFRRFGRRDFDPVPDRRLLIRSASTGDALLHRKHVVNSRRLLRLPDGPDDMNYMSVPMVWHRDWIVALHAHLEALYSRPWQHVLAEQPQLSEYTLYGVFVEEVLAPEALDIRTQPYNFGLWTPEQLPALSSHLETIRRLAVEPDDSDTAPLCFTLQSWLNLPPAEYRKILEIAAGDHLSG